MVGTLTSEEVVARSLPFRYRGYYYDEESDLYYLNSRYYDPYAGRFISADSVITGPSSSTQGKNLFVYCFNNPVNTIDHNGCWPEWMENAGEWLAKKATQLWKTTTDISKIVFTKEFFEEAKNIVLSNFEASAGICIGVGFLKSSGSITVEAISRMDIIGVQIKNGKLRFGHTGRSALGIGFKGITARVANDTFESFVGKREVSEQSNFDYGIAYGEAFAFVIGYHCSVSVSISGIICGIIGHINERLN